MINSITETLTKLIIDPVETDDAGTCTCLAKPKGVGTEDSDAIEITVEGFNCLFFY